MTSCSFGQARRYVPPECLTVGRGKIILKEHTTVGWFLYIIIVLLITGAVGLHLRRFLDAATEMLGMMTGMTMGMVGGFTLGYAAALATSSMFWGNLFGIVLGVIIGAYFGLSAGLMGVMDGGMAGFMAGSMGAMLAVMIRYPEWAVLWTTVLLTVLYAGGVVLLVALVERRAPEQAAQHLVARWFRTPQAVPAVGSAPETPAAAGPGLVNYYELLDIPVKASVADVATAFARYVSTASAEGLAVADAALIALTNPAARVRYDRALALASGRDDCCAPPRRSVPGTAIYAATAPLLAARATPAPAATPPVPSSADTRPAPHPVALAAPPAPMARAARPVSPPVAPHKGTVPTAAAPAPAARAVSLPAHSAKKNGGSQASATHGPGAQRAGRNGPRWRQYTGGGAPRWLPAALGGVFIAGLILIGLILNANTPSASAANTGSAGAQSSGYTAPPGQPPVVVPVGADGVQTLDLVIDGDTFTYQPSVIQVKQGVPVRLNLKTSGRDPGCARLMTVRALGVRGMASPGQTVPVEFTPQQAGTFEINCGMSMMQPGTLIVTQ